MRSGFSLLEVMVATLIITTSILFVFQLHTRTQQQLHYMTRRSSAAWSDSLFLFISPETETSRKIDAYSLLQPYFVINNDTLVRTLKDIKRDIRIQSDTVPFEETNAGKITLYHINMKSARFATRYVRFRIGGL